MGVKGAGLFIQSGVLFLSKCYIMRKWLLVPICCVSGFCANAQFNLNKITSKLPVDSTVKQVASSVLTGSTSSNQLGQDDIINGLKEALSLGSSKSVTKLGAADGFFKDAALKILMPPEAEKVSKTLRSMGMGSLVDKAILSMNRAAEDAVAGTGTILVDAIRDMTITDGLQILRGNNTAATDYLRSKTTASLTEKFRPIVEASLTKTDATKYWKDVFTQYNRFSSKKVNTDLTAYVTEKSLAGIFTTIAKEEQNIRANPAARVSSLLQKVFAQ